MCPEFRPPELARATQRLYYLFHFACMDINARPKFGPWHNSSNRSGKKDQHKVRISNLLDIGDEMAFNHKEFVELREYYLLGTLK